MKGRSELIGVLCDRLRRHYVFADRAEAMCQALQQFGPFHAQGHELAAQLTACAIAADASAIQRAVCWRHGVCSAR